MRAQFLIAIESRLEEGATCLRKSIAHFRKKHMPGHPDRDQIENIDRQAFGPKSLANPPELKEAWDSYQEGARLSNVGEADRARTILASIAHVDDIHLKAHCRMAAAILARNSGRPEEALEVAQEAADLVAGLEPGHWTRRAIEKSVLNKVAVIRKSVFPEPLRGRLSAAVEAINSQNPDSLKLWRDAMAEVNFQAGEQARQEAQRIDRLLTGFEGPLALLLAMENMQKAKAQGDMDKIIEATEAAYYIAYEHDATTTARELESFLESVGRF